MTIRVIGGTDNIRGYATLVLEDDAGDRKEVVAELCDCHCDEGHVTLRVVPLEHNQLRSTLPKQASKAGQDPDPLVALSLAPSWGLGCPYCGYRNHVRDFGEATVTQCAGCRMFYRQPAGALTVAEARRRPTEVK